MTRRPDNDAPPPEGSLAHERFERDSDDAVAPGLAEALDRLTDEYGALGVAVAAARRTNWAALTQRVNFRRNAADPLARLEAERAKDVETHTRRLVIHVDDWVRSLELGPWPGATSTLRRVAEQFCELDEARCALRAVHLQQALPADDDEPPF